MSTNGQTSISELLRLREDADNALKSLQSSPRQRPMFIEFSGTPKSGKSTCIDIVSHFFRRVGFKTLAPTEGASKRTPYYLKGDLVAFNAWSACYALNHILEGLYHSDQYDVAILDRGLFDALVWFELLASRDELSASDTDSVQQFLLVDKWRSVIDTVFLFKSTPEVSMQRENADKLVTDHGRAMNPPFLMELNQAYDSVRKRYEESFKSIQIVDTSSSSTTPRDTAHDVARQTLTLF